MSEGRLGSGTKGNRARSPQALEQQSQVIGCGFHSWYSRSDCSVPCRNAWLARTECPDTRLQSGKLRRDPGVTQSGGRADARVLPTAELPATRSRRVELAA